MSTLLAIAVGEASYFSLVAAAWGFAWVLTWLGDLMQ